MCTIVSKETMFLKYIVFKKRIPHVLTDVCNSVYKTIDLSMHFQF